MDYPIHRFKALADLSHAEVRLLQSLGDAEVDRQKGEVIQREGDPARGIFLLHLGWITSSLALPSGKRLIQKVHLPGDMLSTPNMILSEAPDTLTAITAAKTAFVPYARIGRLFSVAPRLAALFTVSVQLERLHLMDALAAIGQSTALERLARLLIDLHDRLNALGAIRDDRFDLPLTQEAIGDLLGLTAIHVNRTFRVLEQQGLIARSGHLIHLPDIAALRRLSPLPPRRPRFAPEWLPPPLQD